MPKIWGKREKKLRKKAIAKKRAGTLRGTVDGYVFGTLRKMDWRKGKK